MAQNPNYIVLFLVLVLTATGSGSKVTPEKKVLSSIFENYNKDLRPVIYPQDSIKLKFGLALVQLLELNTKEQYMKANIWVRMVWNDVTLKWKEEMFGNTTVLRVSPNMIWIPDMVLFNSLGELKGLEKQTNVLIYPNGEVLWVPPAVFKSSCTIDTTYFPFDQQVCVMKFGSESHNGRELTLSLYNDKNYVDLSDYWISDQWKIVEGPAVHNRYEIQVSPSETRIEEDIAFYLTFRRKLTNYVILLILFSIVLAIVSLFPFLLPLEKSERLILESGCLVAAIIMAIHINTVIPSNSFTYPYIVKYLITAIFLNLFSLISTIVCIHLKTLTRPMPSLIKKYGLDPLSKVLLLGAKNETGTGSQAPVSSIEEGTELNSIGKTQKGNESVQVENIKLWGNLVTITDRVWLIIFGIIVSIMVITLVTRKGSPSVDEHLVIKQHKPI